MLTVPAIAPDTPALKRDPVIMYMSDDFTRPYPFTPTVLDIEAAVDRVIDMLACHQSQVFDWLPYNRGCLDQMPNGPHERRQWLREWYLSMVTPLADRYRELLVATYGAQRGKKSAILNPTRRVNTVHP